MDRRKFMTVTGVAAAALAAGGTRLLPGEALANSSRKKTAGARRWAMAIDLKKCQGTACGDECIHACRATHNVPVFDDKTEEIKWIWKEPFPHAFESLESEYANEKLEHMDALLLCNHCDKPPCVKVCPTEATWKREEDGIVMMDWHRCIGCRYCVAACPYGSRSFNWRDPRPHIEQMTAEFPTRQRGVVEKCTFCDELLAKGEPPACVAACQEKGLIFGDLEDPHSEIRKILAENFTIRRKPELGTEPEVYYLV